MKDGRWSVKSISITPELNKIDLLIIIWSNVEGFIEGLFGANLVGTVITGSK